MKNFKKFGLLFLLCIFPFSLFYFFSLGEHHFERLPYLGPETKGKPFQFPNQPIYDINGKDISNEIKGKTIIVNTLTPDCPENCNFYVGAFNISVVPEISKNKKYNNVIILSEVRDADSSQAKILFDRYSIPGKWYVCYPPQHSFFDVENTDGNLISIDDPDRKNEKIYKRLILLVDKDKHWRGCQDGTQSIKLKTFMDELRLLMKEYFNDHGAY